jgi:Leucine-rich repeat (LRR) protein
MDATQALNILWGRAWTNLQRNHHHNQAAPVKQCLLCGERGRLQENALTDHFFCGERCQGVLWGLDRYLSLDGKRGFVAVKKIIVPNVRIQDLPDDVLWELFRAAYEFALNSVEEMDELMAMRSISPQFVRVIDHGVIPSIRFLCGEILSSIKRDVLALFTGLQTLVFGEGFRGDHKYREVVPQLSALVLPTMRNLRALSLGGIRRVLLSPLLENMKELQVLRLRDIEGVDLSDEAVNGLTGLRRLSIVYCYELTSVCLPTGSLLESLELEDVEHFEDLNQCAGLTHLNLSATVEILDAGIERLTNLTSLSIKGSRRLIRAGRGRRITNAALLKLPNIKILDLGRNAEITDEAVSQLTTLESLIVSEGNLITIAAILQLSNLTSLDMRGNRNLDTGEIHRLQNLRELYLEDADVAVGGDRGIELPPSLTTLSLDRMVGIGQFITNLGTLRCLYLHDCEDVTNTYLKQLTGLEVLDLSRNKLITDPGLRTLTSLEELILIDNAKISYKAVKKLHRLRYLVAINCRLGDREIRALRERRVIVFDEFSLYDVDKHPPHFMERYSGRG